MLINKEKYRVNKKTGDIVTHERVEIKCDICGRVWDVTYDHYVRHLNKVDHCRYCRGIKHIPKKILCDNCGQVMERFDYAIQKHNFCGIKCRDEFNFNLHHSHLLDTFIKNENEVAYLIGLILGDGHIKKVAKKTSRISIAFNFHDEIALSVAENILSTLNIKYFIEPSIRHNCLMLGFILPDKLLDKYGIKYSGNKYSNQPYPVEKVVDNINFAMGLLNSDGCCYETDKRRSTTRFTITFSNTVESIIRALNNCLNKSGIPNRQYTHQYKNPNWKKRLTIMIMKKQWVNFICSQQYSKWKDNIRE